MNSKGKKIEQIRGIISFFFENSNLNLKKVLLFGSRARGDFQNNSDYDILITIDRNISMKHKIKIIEAIRDKLAELLIASDIILKSEDEMIYYKDKIGSIVKNALKEGQVL